MTEFETQVIALLTQIEANTRHKQPLRHYVNPHWSEIAAHVEQILKDSRRRLRIDQIVTELALREVTITSTNPSKYISTALYRARRDPKCRVRLDGELYRLIGWGPPVLTTTTGQRI